MMPVSRVFFLRYRGDFSFEQLDRLKAVLTNDKNISEELACIHMILQSTRINVSPGEHTFAKGYVLPWLPTSNDAFRIDFRLKASDDPIASCRVGKLYKHNKVVQ